MIIPTPESRSSRALIALPESQRRDARIVSSPCSLRQLKIKICWSRPNPAPLQHPAECVVLIPVHWHFIPAGRVQSCRARGGEGEGGGRNH